MAEQTSKFSVFSKIFTCSLLVLSYTFVESWDSAACQKNAVRTSRLLTGHTLKRNAQRGQYAHLKNKLIDLLDEENDDFGKSLNDLVHDEVFRNTYKNLMHEDSFQKKSYRNLDASFDDVRGINEIKRGLQKKSKGYDDSFDIDCFYDVDEASSNTSSAMALEKYDKPRSSRKSLRTERKKKTSTESIKYDYKPEENFETLKEMIMKASAEEELSEGGFIAAFKKFDKQFEVELLRSIKDKALSDYDECRYKTGKGKYKHFMKKFRVYLPPTINMGILMLMLVFKSTLYYTNIFAFLSFTFFAMISYYGYKFAKLQRIRESYKSFDRKKGFRKPIKY